MTTVLTLPGWQGSGPTHWQSHWERVRGCRRVEQDDWMHPRIEPWVARLDDVIAQCASPVVLVAHSLGCALAVHWASRSARGSRVVGALLVAPPDVERASAPPEVRSFAPVPMRTLPFAATVVASTSDPYCGFMRAGLMSAQWGAEFVSIGNAGHINADSALGEWPDGWRMVEHWLQPARALSRERG